MYHPTTRLLTILELLQSRPQISGGELAARLEVDVRTVRRYLTMLQDIGVPVEAERGRHGGYRLRPGFRLPPLMFTDEEALALALGLLVARRLELGATAAGVEGALAKLRRVMPLTLREQLQAVQETVQVEAPLARARPAGETVTVLSLAASRRQRVRLRYQSWDHQASERAVDPYGLVFRAGYWYLAAFCHLRQEVRTFRLDRIGQVELSGEPFERPAGFDSLAHVLGSLPMTPGTWLVEATLATSLEEAQSWVPPALAVLEADGPAVRLRCYVQSLDWLGHFLVSLPWPVTVHGPAELRDSIARLAERAAEMAARSPG
jgi:predicted DNA-binding transcriptional regulator YafY